MVLGESLSKVRPGPKNNILQTCTPDKVKVTGFPAQRENLEQSILGIKKKLGRRRRKKGAF